MNRNNVWLKIMPIAFCCLIVQGCAVMPVKVDIAAKPDYDDKSSSSLEKGMGYTGYYYMLLNFKSVDDQKTVNRLDRIGARLSHYTERPNIRYKYFIIDTKYRNAFSLPDGYIFISNSLIETLGDDEKLAFVVAHEIAHVTHKHLLQSYQRLNDYSPLKSILGQKVYILATELSYDKAYEFQADQTALRYVYRAGFDTRASLDTLGLLKKTQEEDLNEYKKNKTQTKKKDESPIRHPYIENRIVNARSYLEEVYRTEEVQYKPEDFNF